MADTIDRKRTEGYGVEEVIEVIEMLSHSQGFYGRLLERILGLETTDYGNTVGWAVEDELYWIDFNNHKVVIDDDIECYIIETPWDPSPDFLEYYY